MTSAVPQREARSHLGRLLEFVAGVGLLVALVLMPPRLPHFGPSLITPLTTSTLAELALLLAWIVLLALTVVLLQRAILPSRSAARSPAWAERIRRQPARRTRSPRLVRPAPAPRLLVSRCGRPIESPDADLPVDAPEKTHRHGGPGVTIRLLGPVHIEGVRRPRRATTVELLAYLALHPAGASRDELLEAIWPEQDPRKTRPRLWQSVSEARRLLGDAFERDGEHYRLNHAAVRIDTVELERLLRSVDQATETGETTRMLERALLLWRGAPFAGTDYVWSEGHIRRIETTLITLAERTAHARLAAGDASRALQVAERGLELDELNERFMRLLLEIDGALGHRERLTDRYERFRRSLDQELGVEPERETRLLYRRLLAAGA